MGKFRGYLPWVSSVGVFHGYVRLARALLKVWFAVLCLCILARVTMAGACLQQHLLSQPQTPIRTLLGRADPNADAFTVADLPELNGEKVRALL